jgi:hypothetical protein
MSNVAMILLWHSTPTISLEDTSLLFKGRLSFPLLGMTMQPKGRRQDPITKMSLQKFFFGKSTVLKENG